MKNKISRISPERKAELKELIEQIRQESYDQGYEDGKAFVSVETVEENTIIHEGKLLRKVNRRAKKGDYVRFNDLPIDRTYTDCDELYEVHNHLFYEADNGIDYLVYGWDACQNPEVFEVVSDSPPQIEKSANQQRAELIEKAKKFVENNTYYNGHAMAGTGVKLKDNFVCIPKFIVNETSRIVVVLFSLVGNPKKTHSRGIAKCMPGDVFNEWIGKAIALARALEIDIPVEFLGAVQPTKLVIGMIVGQKDGNYDSFQDYKVERIEDEKVWDHSGFAPKRILRIIDDTNAQYEVGE